jgi:hypothetical protein
VAHGPVKSGLREGSFEAAHALAWRGPVTDLPLSGPVETYDAVISGAGKTGAVHLPRLGRRGLFLFRLILSAVHPRELGGSQNL